MGKISVDKALLLAKSHVRKGEHEEARQQLEAVVQAFPNNKRAKAALASLGVQKTKDGLPPQDAVRTLTNLLNQGRFKQAIPPLKKLLAAYPKAADLWNFLGICYTQSGDPENGATAFKKASQLEPKVPDGHINLANALKSQEKYDEAIQSYKRALKIVPNHLDASYNLAVTLKSQGKHDEAIEAYKRVIELDKDYFDAYFNLGELYFAMHQHDDAIETYKECVRLKPTFVDAQRFLANNYRKRGYNEEAAANYLRTLELDPENHGLMKDLSSIYNNMGQFEEAEKWLKRALEIKPDFAEAHRLLAMQNKYTEDDPHLATMLSMYNDPELEDEVRMQICSGLSKAMGDIGKTKESFEFLKESNALHKKILDYDIQKDIDLFDKIKSTADKVQRASLKAKPAEEGDTPVPIFILGMPRSGTTLTEQILSAHPEIAGADELPYVGAFGGDIKVGDKPANAETIREFRKKYMDLLIKHADGKPYVTDKMPHNFNSIGLICAAFPEAKIIHIDREAAAICWSNYKTFFPAVGLAYCHDLSDVVDYYFLFEDLMNFWWERYPDRMYRLDYEELTRNQEEETRKLIDYIGVEWDDACLSPQKNTRSIKTASLRQARQAVYSGSSKAWEKFAPYLDGAFDRLPAKN
ncbi:MULTISPECIES: tetratricopeptide repeat-containing sulfotransferase family protein [Halocynthiibacter]|uniref:Tetratricopeptide repeat protein n=1 Tax=Halocynthiibacter halioticoli TaxID=2986804 RepID=A0AAE3IYS5_9RHOB|nr:MULTISPECIES: tetratricopeptide repeat-containing sulfotransferase family protein [Halocynthiibacter]MCV6824782.1 tetratricopeptide repeat protein [Halocynthiibacter halioticoli]MCW4057783.1 tetratricopeptide repeat protein [Halocynthiibacter sp. SDUM655004]